MNNEDIQIHASSQEALELACEALESRYGARVRLYRYCDPNGEWHAWGTIRTLAPRRPSHPLNKPGHRRIIIS
jgi:hypothetical protein